MDIIPSNWNKGLVTTFWKERRLQQLPGGCAAGSLGPT